MKRTQCEIDLGIKQEFSTTEKIFFLLGAFQFIEIIINVVEFIIKHVKIV